MDGMGAAKGYRFLARAGTPLTGARRRKGGDVLAAGGQKPPVWAPRPKQGWPLEGRIPHGGPALWSRGQPEKAGAPHARNRRPTPPDTPPRSWARASLSR